MTPSSSQADNPSQKGSKDDCTEEGEEVDEGEEDNDFEEIFEYPTTVEVVDAFPSPMKPVS